MHSAATISVPKTSSNFPMRPVPWWTPECTAAVKEKRAAFSRLRRHRVDPHRLYAFRRAHFHARRVFKETRRTSWKSFVSSINSRTSLTQVWNRVRKISGKFTAPSPILLDTGRIVADPFAVAQLLADHFSAVSKKDTTSASGHRRRYFIIIIIIIFSHC